VEPLTRQTASKTDVKILSWPLLLLQLAVVMLESRRIELPGRMYQHDARGFCEDYWSSAITINRIFAELHGYHFVLWRDVQVS